MKLFFDLDGTLIDSKMRLYMLFQHLIPQSAYTFEEYWELKKQKFSHAMILTNDFKFTENQVSEFTKKWMNLIEEKEWLNYDKPFDGVSQYLETLRKNNHKLYLITARQSVLKTLSQLQSFGWSNLFQNILITEQKIAKSDLIRKHIDVTEYTWIIGDTGKDIQTGKELNIKTAAVLSGFLNKEKLAEYGPDRIVASVTQLQF